MRKKKTLKGQEFSLKSIRPIQLKTKLQKHSPAESLRDPHIVLEALLSSMKDGDSLAFKEILSAHLEVINKEAFSKRADIPKRTLFRILTPEGNPTLDNIVKVVHALSVSSSRLYKRF